MRGHSRPARRCANTRVDAPSDSGRGVGIAVEDPQSIARVQVLNRGHVRPHQHDATTRWNVDVLIGGRIRHGTRVKSFTLINHHQLNTLWVDLALHNDVLGWVALVTVSETIHQCFFQRQADGK